jgi:hypothetical protein
MSCHAFLFEYKLPSQIFSYPVWPGLNTADPNMFTQRSPAEGNRNAEDVKVDPLKFPFPWLIPICMFSPFFFTFILFILCRYTIKRYRDKKALARQEAGDVEVGKDVELQVQKFLRKSEVPGHN